MSISMESLEFNFLWIQIFIILSYTCVNMCVCVFNIILLTKSISLSYKKQAWIIFLVELIRKGNFLFCYSHCSFISLKVQNTTNFYSYIHSSSWKCYGKPHRRTLERNLNFFVLIFWLNFLCSSIFINFSFMPIFFKLLKVIIKFISQETQSISSIFFFFLTHIARYNYILLNFFFPYTFKKIIFISSWNEDLSLSHNNFFHSRKLLSHIFSSFFLIFFFFTYIKSSLGRKKRGITRCEKMGIVKTALDFLFTAFLKLFNWLWLNVLFEKIEVSLLWKARLPSF